MSVMLQLVKSTSSSEVKCKLLTFLSSSHQMHAKLVTSYHLEDISIWGFRNILTEFSATNTQIMKQTVTSQCVNV